MKLRNCPSNVCGVGKKTVLRPWPLTVEGFSFHLIVPILFVVSSYYAHCILLIKEVRVEIEKRVAFIECLNTFELEQRSERYKPTTLIEESKAKGES